MKLGVVPSALRLLERLQSDQRRRLAVHPVAALHELGVTVFELGERQVSDRCSCDGAYFPVPRAPRPAIGFVRTPGSRRENFTLMHELGHHLIRSDEDLLSMIADDDLDPHVLEERICDAFAGRMLVADDVLSAIAGGHRPQAADLRLLFDGCSGSLEACAVRLAERLRCEGYVVLLDRRSHSVRFASPSPECSYSWGRGTPVPVGHPAWRAQEGQSYRGQGELVWRSGYKRNLWLDAVGDGTTVVAIFSSERYWPVVGLGILSDPSATIAGPMALTGSCLHCGARVFGTRSCDKCGDVRCRACGKCGCGAPRPARVVCVKCHLLKGKAEFHPGSIPVERVRQHEYGPHPRQAPGKLDGRNAGPARS